MSSDEAKLQQLTTILGALRACYPQRVSDEEWLVTLRRYRAELKRFDATVVYHACEKAWKKYTQWFPSLGQIVEICEAEQKSADCVKPIEPTHQLTDGAWPDDAKQRFAEIMAVLEAKAEERGDR